MLPLQSLTHGMGGIVKAEEINQYSSEKHESPIATAPDVCRSTAQSVASPV